MLKTNWKLLIICVAIPLAVGGISAMITGESMETFELLEKPVLSPPGWIFPVVWTILYLLMGIASYIVVRNGESGRERTSAIIVYAIQLAFNFMWPIFFFNFEMYLLSFIWLILLWILIWVTIILFYRIDRRAGYLLVPYLLWVTFAGYINLFIYLLN